MKATQNSTWMKVAIPQFPKLTADAEAEVVVIGGGIAGILTTYLLAKAGKSVILVEKGRLAEQATGYTTAFITQSIDTDTPDLTAMFGDTDAKRIWDSHGAAIDLIERIVKEEKIECEFMRVPNVLYANDSSEARDLDEEYAESKRLGFKVSLVKDLPFKHKAAFQIAKQAKYHPRMFLAGVVEALERMQVPIYEKTEVMDISGDGPFTVTAGKQQIRATWTVTTTYHPFNNPKEVVLKKGMYRTYILELEAPAGKYSEAIYEDMDNPYHYFRVDAGKGRKGKDRIIIGGEDHRVELKVKQEKYFDILYEYSKDVFGKAYPVVESWSGLIEEPIDGLALIGEYDPKQLIGTAFSGNGMTYGALSAMIFHDTITGKKNPYADLYKPGRTPSLTQLWKKGRDYTEELYRGAILNAIQGKDKNRS